MSQPVDSQVGVFFPYRNKLIDWLLIVQKPAMQITQLPFLQ